MEKGPPRLPSVRRENHLEIGFPFLALQLCPILFFCINSPTVTLLGTPRSHQLASGGNN